jgi:hypothetical protein
MCNAIFLAALLTIVLAGLTLLRCTRSASPNAEMLVRALADLDGPDYESPSDAAHSAKVCITGRDAAHCAS